MQTFETKEIKCDWLGDKVRLVVTPHHLVVTTKEGTFYFEKETGKFDGISKEPAWFSFGGITFVAPNGRLLVDGDFDFSSVG